MLRPSTPIYLVSIVLAIIVAGGVVPIKLMIAGGLAFSVALIVKRKYAVFVVSLALFGLPFIGSVGQVLGIRPTVIVAFINLIICSWLIANFKKVMLGKQEKGIRVFLLWWVSFLLLYSLGVLFGPNSEYAIFGWQYLFIYGNFFAIAGVIAIHYRVSVFETILFGGVWFSFMYPILGSTFYNVVGLTEADIGLRGLDGLDPIATARVAGMLLLGALGLMLFSDKKLLMTPLLGVSILIALPIAWYSYTRQVYVGLILVSFGMVLFVILRNHYQLSAGAKYRTIAIVIVVSFLVVFQLYDFVIGEASQSRIGASGFKLDRMSMWVLCVDLIFRHPVMGIGVGGFQALGHGLWPHNWFIEAWLELGALGILLTSIAAWNMIYGLFSKFISLNTVLWLFLGLYFLLVAQVSGDIPRNSQIMFFVGIGFYSAYLKRPTQFKNIKRQFVL